MSEAPQIDARLSLVLAGARVHGAGDVAGILSVVAEEARALFDGALGAARIDDRESPVLALAGPHDPGAREATLARLAALTPRGAPAREAHAEIERDAARSALLATAGGEPPSTFLLSAPFGPPEARGEVYVARATAFDERDATLLARLADMATLAVANATRTRASRELVLARDALMAIVCRELRGPVDAVVTGAGAVDAHLAADAPDAVRERNFVKRIHTGTARMHRLIDDLLGVFDVEAGALVVRAEDVSPRDAIAQAIGDSAAAAGAKGCLVEGDAIDDGVTVRADGALLRRLLTLLVTNAVKFTPSGKRIVLSLTSDERTATIVVRDEGAGIAAAHLPRVFDRFWKSPDSPRDGAGLGLFIARGIAEANGGRIAIESDLGVGTTVRVTLPRSRSVG